MQKVVIWQHNYNRRILLSKIMDEKFLEEISNLDWKSLGKRMTAIAVHWVNYTFKDSKNNLPKGYTIEDIVHDAIQRGMNRDWKESFEKIRFENYLFGAIRSIVSNLADLSDNQLTDRKYFNRKMQSEGEEVINVIDEIPTIDADDIEIKIDYQIAFDKLEEKINGNKDLEEILTAIRLGMEPREIAEEINKDIKEIYKLKRQLFIIADKIGKSLVL